LMLFQWPCSLATWPFGTPIDRCRFQHCKSNTFLQVKSNPPLHLSPSNVLSILAPCMMEIKCFGKAGLLSEGLSKGPTLALRHGE
jgi:hypothetical protein